MSAKIHVFGEDLYEIKFFIRNLALRVEMFCKLYQIIICINNFKTELKLLQSGNPKIAESYKTARTCL